MSLSPRHSLNTLIESFKLFRDTSLKVARDARDAGEIERAQRWLQHAREMQRSLIRRRRELSQEIEIECELALTATQPTPQLSIPHIPIDAQARGITVHSTVVVVCASLRWNVISNNEGAPLLIDARTGSAQ